MRLAIVVNHAATEHPHATTTVLARSAVARGHRVHLLDVEDLPYVPDGAVGGTAVQVPPGDYPDGEALVAAIRREDAVRERVDAGDLDVLWLRYNPSEMGPDERWGAMAGMLFGRLAVEAGVLVLDDPDALLWAEGKLYLQHFPQACRPRTLVTRSLEAIRQFHRECGGRMVLKPLDGYGGADVFLLDQQATNLATIVENLGRRGFVIAQEFLPAAARGDIRLFVLNGEPLQRDGHYAAIHRVCPDGDFRSNMTVGGRAERAVITDAELELARLVAPRLKADGIFLAGLDIVGDRLVEINTISPGGLWSASRLEGVDFGELVIQAIEAKLARRATEPGLGNRELASG